MTERRSKSVAKTSSNSKNCSKATIHDNNNNDPEEEGRGPISSRLSPQLQHNHNFRPPSSLPKVDLRKEYNRYCKLYSSEPLDIVAGPLEKASYRMDSVQLDLKGRGLRGVDCIALGKILTTNATIFHLNLSDCLLLPQSFQALMDGLGKNTYLKVLELRGNNIQGTMVDNLSTFLKSNHTLKKLLLEWNCLGSCRPTFQSFCDALTLNKGLDEVDLRNNQIADESGIDVAFALKHNDTLARLDLRWNSLGIQGAKALWDAIQGNKMLESMELGGNFVPEEIYKHIQSTLSQRSEKTAVIQDYSTRTNILTSRLQKTEENCKSEIKNMLTVFGDEEAGLKALIRQAQIDMEELSEELIKEKNEKEGIAEELNKLRDDFIKTGLTLQKARNEAKECEEVVGKEEASNKGLREQLLEMQKQIDIVTMQLNRSENELLKEKNEKKVMTEELQKLKDHLTSTSEREKLIQESLEMKNVHIHKLEHGIQLQGEELGSLFDGKISKVRDDFGSIQDENDKLTAALKDAMDSIKEKNAELDILQIQIESLKQSGKRAETLALLAGWHGRSWFECDKRGSDIGGAGDNNNVNVDQ